MSGFECQGNPQIFLPIHAYILLHIPDLDLSEGVTLTTKSIASKRMQVVKGASGSD